MASTVQLWVADPLLPAGSVTPTVNVCEPSLKLL